MSRDEPIIDKKELVERVIFPGENVEYRFNKFDIVNESSGGRTRTGQTTTVYLADVKRDTEKKLSIIPFLTDGISWGNFTSRTQTLGLSILADFFGENNTRNWFQREIIDPFKKKPYPDSSFWLAMHSAGWTLAAIFYQDFTYQFLATRKETRFKISGTEIFKWLNNYGIGIIASGHNKFEIYINPNSRAAERVKAFGSPYLIGKKVIYSLIL